MGEVYVFITKEGMYRNKNKSDNNDREDKEPNTTNN